MADGLFYTALDEIALEGPEGTYRAHITRLRFSGGGDTLLRPRFHFSLSYAFVCRVSHGRTLEAPDKRNDHRD